MGRLNADVVHGVQVSGLGLGRRSVTGLGGARLGLLAAGREGGARAAQCAVDLVIRQVQALVQEGHVGLGLQVAEGRLEVQQRPRLAPL